MVSFFLTVISVGVVLYMLLPAVDSSSTAFSTSMDLSSFFFSGTTKINNYQLDKRPLGKNISCQNQGLDFQSRCRHLSFDSKIIILFFFFFLTLQQSLGQTGMTLDCTLSLSLCINKGQGTLFFILITIILVIITLIIIIIMIRDL